ncbi:MAG: hypothetical protein ACFFCO_06760 [Promethearchaeota archaeon]
MSHYKLYLVLIFSLSIISLSNGLALALNHSASQTEAQQAIDTAQTAIYEAFGQITQADLVGADITDLVSGLNLAINNLNLAHAAFDASDFTSAIQLAEMAQSAAEVIINEAQSRLALTLTSSLIHLLLIGIVIVTAVIVTYFLITRWQKHRQQQTRRLLGMEIRLPREEESDNE